MMATDTVQITQQQNNWTDTVKQIMKLNLFQKKKVGFVGCNTV